MYGRSSVGSPWSVSPARGSPTRQRHSQGSPRIPHRWPGLRKQMGGASVDLCVGKQQELIPKIERPHTVAGISWSPADLHTGKQGEVDREIERAQSFVGRYGETWPQSVELHTARAASIGPQRPHSVAGGRIGQLPVRQDTYTPCDKQIPAEVGERRGSLTRDIDKTTALLRYKRNDSISHPTCLTQQDPKLYSCDLPVELLASFTKKKQDGSVSTSMQGTKRDGNISKSVKGTKSIQKRVLQPCTPELQKDTTFGANSRVGPSVYDVNARLEASTANAADLALAYETDYEWSTLSQLLDTANELCRPEFDPTSKLALLDTANELYQSFTPKASTTKFTVISRLSKGTVADTLVAEEHSNLDDEVSLGEPFGGGNKIVIGTVGSSGRVLPGDAKIATARHPAQGNTTRRTSKPGHRLSSLVQSL